MRAAAAAAAGTAAGTAGHATRVGKGVSLSKGGALAHLACTLCV
jgi:hypothetical protein